MIANRVVVHVPHSSLVVPGDAAADLLITPNELDHELLLMTDHYTDELFALPLDVATTVTFPVSRIVVDPERFTDDDREPMTQKGMGVVYTRTSDGRPLRRAPSPDERARLLARFYEPHHAALTVAVAAALEAHGACLVLDAHSFPAQPLPYEDDERRDAVRVSESSREA
jgi:N-formylglutamate deformylase